MFLGYLSFAGTEVWNSQRTATYANELVPGVTVLDCADCTDLPTVLGDKPYTTPFVDQAPWFDPNNPATWDFCGIVPLSAEGVEDSTVNAQVTDLIGGGGYVSAPVHGPREMRFTGLLVGADEAAVEAGMSWLKAVLETNPCSATPGCTGDHLCYLAACPEICEDSPNIPPDHIRYNLAPNPRGRANPARGWSAGTSEPGYAEPGKGVEAGFVRENLVRDPAATTLGGANGWAFTSAPDAVRTNLHINPRLQGAPVTGATSSDVATGGPDGRSWRQGLGGAAGSTTVNIGHNVAYAVPVDGESLYQVSVYAYRASGGAVRIFTRRLDADGAQVGSDLGSTLVTLAPATWTRLTYTYNAGNNPTTVSIVPRISFTGDRPAGEILGGAQMMVEQAATLGAYFDGGTPDTDVTVFAWTGPENASTSTATRSDASVVRTAVTGGPVTDERTVNTYVTAVVDVPGDVSWSVPVDRVLGAAVMNALYVRRTMAGQVRLPGAAAVSVPAGTWTRVSAPGTSAARLVVAFPDAAAGERVEVSAALVETTATLGVYFDGSSPSPAPELDYRWTGAVNGSRSRLVGVTPDSPQRVGFQYAMVSANTPGPIRAVADGPATVANMVTRSVAEGVQLGARAQVYVPPELAAGGLVSLRGGWRDVEGRPVGVSDFSFQQVANPAAGWMTLAGLSPLAPAGAVHLAVYPQWSGTADNPLQRGSVLAWAALIVEEDTVPEDYFDGDFTDDMTVIYTWQGPADASVSVATPNTARLCPSGEFPTMVEACSIPFLRHMRVVTTTSGPTVMQKYSPSCGAMWQVEWTMVAGVPFAYSSNYFIGSTTCPSDQCVVVDEVECVAASANLVTDPDCPPLPLPPRPPDIPVDCLDVPDQWCRFAIDIPSTFVPTWSTGIPTIRLKTGGEAVRQLRLRFYSNPFDRALDMLDGCDFCGEFLVSYIPPNSIMTIDGVEQQVQVEQPGGRISTGNHLLYGSDGGPMSWPELICGIPFTTVVDVSPTLASDILVTLCVAYRT